MRLLRRILKVTGSLLEKEVPGMTDDGVTKEQAENDGVSHEGEGHKEAVLEQHVLDEEQLDQVQQLLPESVLTTDREPEQEAEQFTDAELNEWIEVLCLSKADEFRLIGYEHVTGKEVWACVSDKYAKHGQPPLHRIVNDILSLKVTQFMNFMTMSAFRGTHF
ncbi:hypothetical protein EBB07_00320 [Paenibacillaceae bacterium]|nr:hypothetical protein EBB07_00320 [Paenibacillaceae bacterium]